MYKEHVFQYIKKYIYDSINSLYVGGYDRDSVFVILLALYSFKNKEQDDIYNELAECTHLQISMRTEMITNIHAFLKESDYEDFLAVYPHIVHDLIYKNFSHNIRNYNRGGYFFESESVNALLCGLIKRRNISSFYNPFARIASLPILLNSIPFYAQEMDRDLHAIGMVLLDAHGLPTDTYSSRNSLEEWNPTHAECVVSIPYFSVQLPPEVKNGISVWTCEEFVFYQFMHSSEKYAYYLVPNSFCYGNRKTTKKLRESIIDNNYLDMVISLTSGIFSNTGIATSVIVLNKERKNEDPVHFVNANMLFSYENKIDKRLDEKTTLFLVDHPDKENSILITNDEIRANDYNWNVQTYISKQLDVFPEGYEIVDFKNIVEEIPQKRNTNEKEGRLIRTTFLSNDASDYERTPESFDWSDDLKNTYKLEEPAILLSSLDKLKPTYCTASHKSPVFVNFLVRAFRIKEKWVNPAYLCLEISKRKGLSVGAIVPHISLKQMLGMKLPFPSIGTQQSYIEQGRLFNEFQESNKLAKAKELGLLELIEKMKSDYIFEVRNRKHDMKTPMAQLRSTLILLDALAEDLSDDTSKRLKTYIDRQKVALDTLSEIVRHLADEDVFAEPEILDIDALLSSLVESNDSYNIRYQVDTMALKETGKKKPTVFMGKSDFLRLTNNIIGNAINHGFVDKELHYELVITLSAENGYYVIDFSNNGKPLPEGMDKERFGMKGVKGKDSEGQGTGGYVIKSIVEHYGGDYDIFTREIGDITYTDIIVKLQIHQSDE